MPFICRPAYPVVVLWEDVLAVTNNKPYSLCRVCYFHGNTVSLAKKRGYFNEAHARRIHDAYMGRVPLVRKSDVVNTNTEQKPNVSYE
jgi:hypothetical protein